MSIQFHEMLNGRNIEKDSDMMEKTDKMHPVLLTQEKVISGKCLAIRSEPLMPERRADIIRLQNGRDIISYSAFDLFPQGI